MSDAQIVQNVVNLQESMLFEIKVSWNQISDALNTSIKFAEYSAEQLRRTHKFV